MVEKEDLELNSSHSHKKLLSIYRATINTKDQKASRDLLYVKKEP